MRGAQDVERKINYCKIGSFVVEAFVLLIFDLFHFNQAQECEYFEKDSRHISKILIAELHNAWLELIGRRIVSRTQKKLIKTSLKQNAI